MSPVAIFLMLLIVDATMTTVLISCSASSVKAKRQIYREQLLPDKGGKIPDSAFQVDRLALNRLNKEGISVPDGILFEQRNRESHYKHHRNDPDIVRNIIRLIQTPDGRYTAIEGRYPAFDDEIESTYIIRSPYYNAALFLPAFRPLHDNTEESTALRIPTAIHKPAYSSYNAQKPDELLYTTHHNSILRQPQSQWNFDTVNEFNLPAVLMKIGHITDYPSLTEIPATATSFLCDKSGRMYADPKANCQVFHLCHLDGQKETFLCPPGSRFETLTHQCNPWHRTQCIIPSG